MADINSPSKRWDQFLVDLHDALSQYDIQKDVSRYSHIITDELSPQSLGAFLKNIGKDRKYSEIQDIELNEGRVSSFKELVTSALGEAVWQLDPKSKTLTVKGEFVTVSAVIKKLQSSEYSDLAAVNIFALNKTFIDDDVNFVGKKIQLTIISPYWEVRNKATTIRLDGADANSLPNPKEPKASTGMAGAPGLPGGSAGSFVGIGKDCNKGCHDLTVLANGGKGGPGQIGGDGHAGSDGKKPREQVKHVNVGCDEAMEQPWKEEIGWYSYDCDGPYEEWYGWFPRMKYLRQTCNVDGGGRGGSDGGSGGKGGIGGRPGRSTLIMQGYDDIAFIFTTPQPTKGEDGLPGGGGKGGKGGKKFSLKINISDYITRGWPQCSASDKKPSEGRHEDGSTGTPGRNDSGRKDPEMIPVINVSLATSTYKSYLRENLHLAVIRTSLLDFLNYLETDKKVTGLYDVVGLVEDLLTFEKQSQKLEKYTSIVPFYKQFLNRLDQYQLRDNEKADDYKMVLNFLYSSALSKVCMINSDENNDLVVKVRDQLEIVSGHIQNWKEFKNIVENNNSKDSFKEAINKKIQEANKFIDEDITKDIDDSIRKTNEQLSKLYTETENLIKEGEKEKDKFLKEKDQLERQLALRTVLGVVQIASQALTLAGPVGAAAGTAIGQVTMVVQNYALSDSPSSSNAISAVPEAVTNTVKKMSEAYKSKQELYIKQLNKANEDLKEYLKKEEDPNKPPPPKTIENLKKIQGEIDKTKSELETATKNVELGKNEYIGKMYNRRKDLDILIEKQKEEIKSHGTTLDERSKNIAAVADKIQNYIGLAKMGTDLYGKVQGDITKINEVDKSIKKANEKLKALEDYEYSIYKEIAPLITRMSNSAHSLKDSEGKSHAALDVTKWKVASTIGEIRKAMVNMTEGYKTQKELAYFIDKVDHGMSTMVQVYDRIQEYHDNAQLVDYIANIGTDRGLTIVDKMSEGRLKEAVDALQLQLQNNLIVSDYERIMNAARQYFFPFVPTSMKQLHLPYPDSALSMDKIATQISRRLQKVKDTVIQDVSTIPEYQGYSISNAIFAEGPKNRSPFFIWEHQRIRDVLSKLLKGEPVELKADIPKDSKEYAVKFNVVGIRFRSPKPDVQQKLDKAMELFSIEMTHLGESYYKCGSKSYVMFHDQELIKHSVMKENGEYWGVNDVYTSLYQNRGLLSPFAMWKLQLTQKDDDFSSLSEFMDEVIDLQLEGRGRYVENKKEVDEKVCTDELNKYFTPVGANYEESRGGREKNVLQDGSAQRRLLDEEEYDLDDEEEEDYMDGEAEDNIKENEEHGAQVTYSSSLKNSEYLNPVHLISKWASEGNPAEPMNSIEKTQTANNLQQITTQDESSVKPVVYSSIDVPANLAFYELLIRKINGYNRRKRSVKSFQKDYENEFAHNLAYNAYAPK